MTDSSILTSLTDSVLSITLNRPDVLNSFNRGMAKEFRSALEEAERNREIRAVLITGAGRAFCAGQDLAEVNPTTGGEHDLGNIVRDSYNPILKLLLTIEKPVIAAVNGVAAGAGANLALACDVVFAAENASFIQAFSQIGLIPDTGGTFILPQLVGLARAKYLAFSADKISAEDALHMGLISKVCPAAELMTATTTFATRLASGATKGFGLTKRAMHAAVFGDIAEHLQHEETLQRMAGATKDYAEGVAAFLEKRKPIYRGE